MLSPGTYLQNRYEILEQIGSGGMSVVYKAQCHTLNRLVAIKVLKEEFATDSGFVSKFKMEAQSAARLSHPNIVSVYDVVDEEDLHYIVMELIEGVTLKSYIEQKGVLENKEVIGIAIQVASGIAAAHEQHIIHRDIKPQNMIIARDGSVKVADFGIARAVSTQTLNATAVGSVHYISPEQARGGYCDERSDIYSFGITIYEMVTGRVPFEGENTVSIALAHLEEPAVPPSQYNPEVSLGLEQIILRCIQKKPDNRYSGAAEVIADLRKVLVNPSYDIYEGIKESAGDPGSIRPITREEPGRIQQAYETSQETRETEEDSFAEEESRKRSGKKKGTVRRTPPSREKRRTVKPPEEEETKERDVSSQFERIITGIGVVAAILVVSVVIFLFSRLTGLFRAGTDQSAHTIVATTEAAAETIEVTTSDNQVSMPDVLGMPEELAEERLQERGLMMYVSARNYSENYPEGQIMGQNIPEGTVVEKWSQVDVTVSKGSDKVDLTSLNLTNMKEEEAKSLLSEKELTVNIQREFSNTAEEGSVTRFTPDTARAGETVTLYISQGAQTVPGQVPELRGKDRVTADALLAGAGLITGEVTYEASDLVPEGQIISQSVPADTVLTPQMPVDYVVSGTDPTGESDSTAEEKYYISSLDTTCSLSDYIGPASQTSSVKVLVRLKQQVDGAYIYTTLIKERLVVGAQDIPIVLPRIKGAYGVDSGTVEVVDAGSDNLKVIASYPLTFFPIG